MKAIILAGGFGTRLSEETDLRPKPMIEIGSKPILWHIMKTYSQYGINEFVILLGYKGYWKVTLVDTGLNAMTGARIKKAKQYIDNEPFLLTYGDGVGNINIQETLDFHKQHGKLLTMTSVQPDGRFGALNIDQNTNQVSEFQEKPKGDGSWINAGYFVCQPEILDYIDSGDGVIFEQEPLKKLAKDGQIHTYQHDGFWMPMDSLRDKTELNKLWENKQAPWKVWK
jgi:glucose-1-phosphate cytidylyltransferase